MATREQDRQSPAEARRDGQDVRIREETEGKDARRLIVEVAERLFRRLGFQKTTVADIARELQMSPADVYHFFGAKSEINAAVCLGLLGKIEAEAGGVAVSRGTAHQRMRILAASVEKAHRKQYMFDRKLHELIEAALTENWTIMREHNHRMTGMLEQIIASGMASGEFHPGDAALAALLVYTACSRFWHPLRMAEYVQEPEPTLDHMLDFCLTALKPAMAARLEHDATGRAEKKPNPVVEKTGLPSSDIMAQMHAAILQEQYAAEVEQDANLSPHMLYLQGTVLWDKAIESLGRSAGVLEELAESTGEAIARIAARGDRIDRIQKETRALLNSLVTSEADA